MRKYLFLFSSFEKSDTHPPEIPTAFAYKKATTDGHSNIEKGPRNVERDLHISQPLKTASQNCMIDSQILVTLSQENSCGRCKYCHVLTQEVALISCFGFDEKFQCHLWQFRDILTKRDYQHFTHIYLNNYDSRAVYCNFISDIFAHSKVISTRFTGGVWGSSPKYSNTCTRLQICSSNHGEQVVFHSSQGCLLNVKTIHQMAPIIYWEEIPCLFTV